MRKCMATKNTVNLPVMIPNQCVRLADNENFGLIVRPDLALPGVQGAYCRRRRNLRIDRGGGISRRGPAAFPFEAVGCVKRLKGLDSPLGIRGAILN